MGEEHRIDVFEHAVAHHERLARDQLFGDPGPKQQRAGNVVALHQVPDRQRRDDIHRLA